MSICERRSPRYEERLQTSLGCDHEGGTKHSHGYPHMGTQHLRLRTVFCISALEQVRGLILSGRFQITCVFGSRSEEWEEADLQSEEVFADGVAKLAHSIEEPNLWHAHPYKP